MNDFTKEELELIYYHLENEPVELSKKIQSMIDNYCDHECTHEFERQTLLIDFCDKCKNFKFVFKGHEE
jgi:hypothetical protein